MIPIWLWVAIVLYVLFMAWIARRGRQNEMILFMAISAFAGMVFNLIDLWIRWHSR